MMLDSPVVEELIGFANEELKNATSSCLVSKNCDLNSFFSFSGVDNDEDTTSFGQRFTSTAVSSQGCRSQHEK